jgi:hypothetical protein
LNFFIDVAVVHQQFCIRSCATNEIVLFFPKGLYGFKTSDVAKQGIGKLASRMIFEEENRIRIINTNGLDTVLRINLKNIKTKAENNNSNDSVIIKSVCKIDHFDEEVSEKHSILDKNCLPLD